MSAKIRLAKSKDSRTRANKMILQNIEEAEALLQYELQNYPEFTRYLLRKGYSVGTIKNHINTVINFKIWAEKENIPIEYVVYADVLHYIQVRKKRVKQKTIGIQLNSLRHYFSFLIVKGDLYGNPTLQIQLKGIKRRSLYQILTIAELGSLYENFIEPDIDSRYRNQNWFRSSVLAAKRNKVILGLMVYQGIKVEEIQKLKEEDFKLREGKLYVAGTRRSNERYLKLEAHQILDAMDYLLHTRKELLQLTEKSGNELFVSVGSSDYSRSILAKLISKLHALNSKVISAKQIRASVITHWLKIYNLRQVQYMAGHRYVSSTEAYLVNDLEDLQKDIGKYHPLI